MYRIYISIMFFLMLFSTKASAQQDNLNMWLQYTMSAKLSEKYSFTALSQYRAYDLVKDSRLFLVSTYLERKLDNDLYPAVGFMFLVLQPYTSFTDKKIRYENRPFQQLTIKSKLGRTTLLHRYRVEERFLTNPDDFVLRLRYLISLKIPLGKEKGNNLLYGILKNEIRMNVVKEEQFDSNRITAGLGINLGKQSAIELSFVNQVSPDDTSNYVLAGFRNSFDWSAKTENN
ncbi:DUF2490 domain-containing protein [Flavobacterium collinsii]|uniref:DUF2490 domain-containing protein n=1 Tax=Flavobacterium collinsii TaxID=1114861 RepID=A0ABN7EH52_9FLAO|nr:DUF2490 domain-containing protein [Flavobacterium collinsii]GIQ59108.1 hypothetical protein Flavo103_22440 [Flavobacterium collinsii]CAA9196890.1 hypothetical protein FLACOL7796_01378 [Flavobacterium collinsii]